MTQPNELRPIPFIDLVGDVEENYYQLGLKDADAAKLSLNHTESLIKTPWNSVDTGLRLLAQSLFMGQAKWKSRFSPWLSAYAEGLGVSNERLMLALLVPELTACLAKWLPRLPKSLMGCSSLFFRNDQGELTHVRTLDFPLGTTFDANERILRTRFKDAPIITSYGSAGLPYPSLTATTSEGISFALHQKFNDVFDPSGTPIFELVQDMLHRCGDLKTCLGFLRKSKSLTTWSFHIGFKDGQVLEADLSGSELNYNTYHIDEQDFLYFNNNLIKPSPNQNSFPPLNFANYNRWRHESAKRKYQSLSKKNDKNINSVLKSWTTLEKRKTSGLDVLTPSSLHVAALVPNTGELHAVMGNAPKTWKGQIQSELGLWNETNRKTKIHGKIKPMSDQDKACRHLLEAQSAHDLGETHKLHHHLQMALRRSRGSNLEMTTMLYGHIFTFLNEKHPKVLSQLLGDVLELSPKLPSEMVDHAWLLISRLERVLNLKATIVPAQMHHPRHARLLDVENSIPSAIFPSLIRTLIHPRIDLMDVIHVHERLDP